MSSQEQLEITFARKLSSQELETLARLSREGKKTRELARKFGMAESDICLALRRAARKGLQIQA